MREDLLDLINKEYEDVDLQIYKHGANHQDVVNRLNTIIQIKVNYDLGPDVTIYRDLKLLTKHYILSLENQDFNYDQINFEFIKNNILHLDDKQRYDYLQYLLDLLNKGDIRTDYRYFEKEYFKTKLRLSFKEFELKKIATIIHVSINYNIFTLCCVLALVILSLNCILLPAPSWSYTLFNVELKDISQNKFLNTLYNLILWLIGLNDDMKILPVGVVGVSLLILFKLIFIGIFIDLGLEQIKKRIGI